MAAGKSVILSIDQGTTSTRTLVFSEKGRVLFTAQEEFPQIYPHDGWVEHDPETIWNTTLSTLTKAHAYAKKKGLNVLGIGITNQRETTLVWDRNTGKCIYNAIVWQDRRTAGTCREIKSRYNETDLTAKTGLLLDPYFSATKAAWILDNVKGARQQAKDGNLAFGTIDSFLINKLTEGRSHFTDATNASRTNLFNIHSQDWDGELLELFDVPANILPEVKDCAANFGTTKLLGDPIKILGVAGDQHAAAIGQCCFETGSLKSTYGTGCFVLMNTGDECVTSKNRLLSTIAYRLDGKPTYALEGSIFVAGAAVQWLRDELRIIKKAKHTEKITKKTKSNNGVYLVPAFTGLGAPYWDPDARGAIFGITRDTGRADIVRATLESMAYQTHDLFEAMAKDGVKPTSLKVDGGMVANNWMVQFLCDILNLPVERPKVMETTALGVAYLVGLQCGLYKSLDDISANWKREAHFKPTMTVEARKPLLAGWARAVGKVLSPATD